MNLQVAHFGLVMEWFKFLPFMI